MSWNYPNSYFFLFLLAGLATYLAVIYERIQKFTRKPAEIWSPILPVYGLQRDRLAGATEEWASKQPSDFCRLCESVEGLPPKEQTKRVREYFGIVGGMRRAATLPERERRK